MATFRLVLVVVILAWQAVSHAEVFKDLSAGPIGEINFESSTPRSFVEHLKGPPADAIAHVWGELSMPPGVKDKVPAIIYLHHAGGYAGSEQGLWKQKVNQWGFAFFPINSFRPRGIVEMDGRVLPSQATDALRALKLLATHPGIDPNRIIVMGTSIGGMSSFEAMIESVRTRVSNEVKFAAGIGLYSAPCEVRFLNVERSKTPFLWLAAEKEDWTDLRLCRAYVENANANSGNARFVVLPSAYHGFDQSHQIFKGNLRNLRGCNYEVDVKTGAMRRGDNGTVFAQVEEVRRYLGSCGSGTASLVGDASAIAAAEKEITSFLNQVFRGSSQ